MLKLQAIIKWKQENEGGLVQKPFSGIQPSFSIKDDLIMSQVLCLDGNDFWEKDREHEVQINLPYGEKYVESIKEGLAFNLNVGGQVIATGIVQKIVV